MEPHVDETEEIPCLISGLFFCRVGVHRICTRTYEVYHPREEQED